MDVILATHRINKSTEDVTVTVGESESDNTKQKLQSPSESVVEPLSDARSETARVVADFSDMT